MRISSLGLSLVIVATLVCASMGRTEAPPAAAPLARQAASPVATVVAPAEAAARPSPRVARPLDDRERDSVLGVVLLIALKRSAQAH